MSSTSRRRNGVAILAILLGALVGIFPTTTVGAAGKPAPAQFAFDVSIYGYGSVTVGQTPSHTFTLSNPGGKAVGSVSVSVSGAGMGITGNGCGKSLKPRATCDVTVDFAPEGAGAFTGTLTASARGMSPAIVSLTGTGLAASADRYLYWGPPDIGRAQLDGTSLSPSFVVPATGPSALEVGAGYIYWASYPGSVLRIPVDGTGAPQTVYAGGISDASSEILGIAVSETYVYWTNYSKKEIWRASLDGTGAEAFLTGLDNPSGLDVADDYIYWSEYSMASKILRVPLTDPTSTPAVLYEYPAETSRGPAGLDVGNGRVYWAETDWTDYAGSVLSAPVGGGEAHVDVTPSAPNRIEDVALDTDGGWLYYAIANDSTPSDSSIARRMLDGTGDPQTVVPVSSYVYGLAIG